MRKIAPFFLASLLVVPLMAIASAPPTPTPDLHDDTSSTADSSTGNNPASGSNSASNSNNNNGPTAPKNDPCYNVVVSEQPEGSTPPQKEVYTKQATNDCETVWKQSGYSIQKFCKVNAYQAGDYKYVDASGNTSPIAGGRCAQMNGNTSIFAAQTVAQSVVNNIDPTSDVGKQQLTQALQNLGASQTDAQSAVAQDPTQVKSLLNDIAQGNSSGAQTIANSLNLNSDVLNNISQMQPGQLPAVLNGVASADQVTSMNQALNSPSTIPSGSDPDSGSQTGQQTTGQCGITGDFAPGLAYAESRCGANTTNSYSSVQGPYQFLCSTWNSYANSTGNSQYTCSCGSSGYAGTCSYVNDPNISSQIVESYYQNWIQGPQGQACIAAGNTSTSCVYADHWLGSGGLNAALNLETSNPNGAATALCSSAASAACSGGNMSLNNLTMSQMFQQLDTRQGIGSGTLIGSMSSPGSPLGTLAGGDGGIAAAAVVGTSPVAAAGLIPISAQSNNLSNNSLNSLLPLMLLSSALNNSTAQPAVAPPPPAPVQTTATTPTTPTTATTQTQTAGTTQTITITPTDSINAQPPIVAPGNPIYLTWSSAGVTTTPACEVTENGTLFIQANNGSTTVPTIASTPVGKKTFTITCTATSGGATLQQSASVVIN